MTRWAHPRHVGVIVVVCVLAAACGSTDSGGEAPARIETPATIVGVLELAVEEGPVGEDDLSEINFGSVAIDGGEVLVQISGDVLRAAGVDRDTIVARSRFEFSLARPSELFDDTTPYYVVDSIAPLD